MHGSFGAQVIGLAFTPDSWHRPTCGLCLKLETRTESGMWLPTDLFRKPSQPVCSCRDFPEWQTLK